MRLSASDVPSALEGQPKNKTRDHKGIIKSRIYYKWISLAYFWHLEF